MRKTTKSIINYLKTYEFETSIMSLNTPNFKKEIIMITNAAKKSIHYRLEVNGKTNCGSNNLEQILDLFEDYKDKNVI